MHLVGTTITISEQLYREALRPKQAESAVVSDLPVFGGSGVLPGVDLSNAAALLDEMDRGDGLDALR